MSVFVMVFFMLFGPLAQGQNLVANPSFEEVYKPNCSWSSVSFPIGHSIAHWESANAASPDMHSLLVADSCWAYADGSEYDGNASCQPGSQLPRTGSVMVGFITTNDSSEWREYVRNELLEPMIPGKLYSVQFYVSLADNSAISSNNIGVYFSTDRFESTNTSTLPYTPQVEVKQIIGNDVDWVEIDTVVLASEPWKYLTIGNFRSNEETDIKDHQFCPWAYYYIDDVSVILSENQTTIPTVFTPNGDGLNDTFRPYLLEPESVDARIYNRWGRLIYRSNDTYFEWSGENKTGLNVPDGVYYWVIAYRDRFQNEYNLKGYVSVLR
ncbi:MAG: gliding motility-associated C-terminal domain-containing protein [Flavobacteriales bacterium]|nr:gliding motility-associated C-terminal domain-containing protein [Flavobacteriales bacterium]